MKILHIGLFNTAGMPYEFVKMHKTFGIDARLITVHRNPFGFEEDICLDIPLPTGNLASRWRKFKHNTLERKTVYHNKELDTDYRVYKPRNLFEKFYFKYQDKTREKIVHEAIEKYRLESYDIIHVDGGIGFFKDARIIKKWKSQKKKSFAAIMGVI